MTKPKKASPQLRAARAERNELRKSAIMLVQKLSAAESTNRGLTSEYLRVQAAIRGADMALVQHSEDGPFTLVSRRELS